MALFTLSDIKFKPQDTRSGMDSLMTQPYEINMVRYPKDLGSVDKGHYMVFHICVQDKTSYAYEASGIPPSAHTDRTDKYSVGQGTNVGGYFAQGINDVGNVTSKITDIISKKIGGSLQLNVDNYSLAGKALSTGNSIVSNAIESLKSVSGTNFVRTITRTTESIALYMPNTLNFSQDQGFTDIQMGGENMAKLGAGYSIIRSGKSPEEMGKNLTPFIAEAVKDLASGLLGPNSTKALFATAFGAVQNPQLELLYTTPSFRNFQFEFMFYPRDEQEALDVQKIINRLKFHQSPEVLQGSNGYFLVPPSEFDIEFYYNGSVNDNIPKIKTCVLRNLNVDYAPNGFHAFESVGQPNPTLGGTGMPFAIRLTLQFTETVIMTKENYKSSENV